MSEPALRSTHKRTFLLAVLVALVSFLPFAGALGNGFVRYDDPAYVTNNPPVLAGWTAAGVEWAFSAFHSANWHPLTWLSHMLDVELWGLEPGGHHLTSLLLHALNGALLFLVLRAYTGATWRPLAAALLFAVHPLRVESVAWVSERKDVLSTFFFLGMLLVWQRWIERGSAARYLSALTLFACGLMSKSMLVTVPCVLLLLDLWPLARFRERGLSKLLLEKLPFFVLAGIAAALAVQSQQSFGATRSLESLGLDARAGNAVLAYGMYLAKSAWPMDLACIYPHPRVIGSDVVWPTLVSGLALVLVSAVAWFTRRSRPYVGIGWAWFLGTLVPVIGLVQVGNQGWADRYTYLPGMGLVIALVWWATELMPRGRPIRVLAMVGGIVILVLGFLTQRQVKVWADSETLFRHATDVDNDNYVAWSNLGIVLAGAGRAEEAVAAYREALRVRPDHSEANNNLGGLLLSAGRTDAAVPLLETAVRVDPSYVAAHMNLGYARRQQGRLSEALVHYKNAVTQDPRDGEARYALAEVYRDLGRWKDAEAELQQAQRLGFRGAAEALQKLRSRQGG